MASSAPATVPLITSLIVPQGVGQVLDLFLAVMQKEPWAGSTNYDVNDIIVSNGSYYGCTQAGTSDLASVGGPSAVPNSQTPWQTVVVPDGSNGLTWLYLAPSVAVLPMPTTSWQEGSVPQTSLQMDSVVITFWQNVIATIAQTGFLSYASNPALQRTSGPMAGTSPWVDVIAQQFFQLLRSQNTQMVGYFLLTDTAGVGPITITPGSKQVSDGAGHTYTNTNPFDGTVPGFSGSFSGGVIPKNGSLLCMFSANTNGSAFNIAPGSTLTLTTATPGISVTNPIVSTLTTTTPVWFPLPALYPPAVSNSYLVTPGTDVESDASLTQRCWNKWSELGTGSPIPAMKNWCFAAGPAAGHSNEVRNAIVQATGFGGVNVVLYGNNAGVSAQALADVAAYFQTQATASAPTMGRLPGCTVLAPGSPANAIPLPCWFQITLWGPSQAQAAASAAAYNAVLSLIQNTPVGGYPITPGTPDQYGISNGFFVQAALDAARPFGVTACKVSTGYSSTSLVAGSAFFMPPDPATGIPVVAAVPSGMTQGFGALWFNI